MNTRLIITLAVAFSCMHCGDTATKNTPPIDGGLDAGKQLSSLSVRLAVDTPTSQTLTHDATNVNMLKFVGTADTKTDATIQTFVFKRVGVINDTYIKDVELWGGGTSFGSLQFDPQTQTYRAKNIGFTVLAGTSFSWTLSASLQAKGEATCGFDLIEVVLVDHGDVYDLPVEGNLHSVVQIVCKGPWTPNPTTCTNEGELCDDTNPCTVNDTCSQGVCTGYPLTYCVPCRYDGDCCGNDMPAYCPGPPGQQELVTTGRCEMNGRCEQKSQACSSNSCTAPAGCD